MAYPPSHLRAFEKSSWPFNGVMYVAPKDEAQLPNQSVQILSIRELRNFTKDALEMYKVRVCNAKIKATTPAEIEAFEQQLERVNTVLNENERRY